MTRHEDRSIAVAWRVDFYVLALGEVWRWLWCDACGVGTDKRAHPQVPCIASIGLYRPGLPGPSTESERLKLSLQW